MTFKNKNKNRNLFNSKKTIDAINIDILKDFESNKQNISNYKTELLNKNRKINKLKKDVYKDSNILNNFDLQLKLWQIEDEKIILEDKIREIENSDKEKEYLINTGEILNTYYKIKDNEKYKINNTTNIKKKISKQSVLYWFGNTKQFNSENGKEILKLKCEKNKEIEEIKQNTKKDKLDNMTKKDLYNNFMKLVDENFDLGIIEDTSYNICELCSKQMLLYNTDGMLICTDCGIQEQILLDSDKPSYKNTPKEITSFCYKRINHLNEFLAQFQAKETTIIPDELYNEILVEIKKERIKNMAAITPNKMRLILRKIKRNDFYEHIPYIINQLNGLPPPIISTEVEEIIRNMFKEIQRPFEELRPKIIPKRKNFLSYNYVMYKFFELLELDEYLECFQLLKSRTKLHQQDIIWKEICKELQWQYIPSL
jgi:hypothetical protein